MKYSDWVDAHERIDEERQYLNSLSIEEFASLDIAQQISSNEFQIEQANRNLKRLRKAAKDLPKPDKEKVERISSQLVIEGHYRFRGKRDLEKKLYKFTNYGDE